MDFTPSILAGVSLDSGSVELLEWRWPDMIDFCRTESELMLEMSLPPHATDASAEFPDVECGNHCFMGTMFIRYPGVALHGRGEGGHIRVLRCVFAEGAARSIMGERALPPLSTLQGLLDIRNDTLRTLMGLALCEISRVDDRSADVLDAILRLLVLEMRRLFEQLPSVSVSGRLAAWQYRRIRERLSQGLASGQPLPTAADLAALCGISVRHLHRRFLALTGSTVAHYVQNYWVDQAKAMLRDSDVPIKSIAFAIGFFHPNSFARAFRRAVGTTPHGYRQYASEGEGVKLSPKNRHLASCPVPACDDGSAGINRDRQIYLLTPSASSAAT